MDKIRVDKITRYTTTDKKKFIGKNAKQQALDHQKGPDVRAKMALKLEDLLK